MNFLETVRGNIGNDAFRSLFELSSSSALAVAIDTSGSMATEIAAVKTTIREIIANTKTGGTAPSLYILAPYESVPVLTITKDTDVVEAALDAIVLAGGTELTFTTFKVIKSM